MSVRQRLFYALSIVLTTGIVIWIYRSDPQVGNIGEALRRIDIAWVLVAALFMLVFWLFDACSIAQLSRAVNLRLLMPESFRIALIGQFYGAVTPSASGAQPAQLVYLTQRGVPASVSTPMLVTKFLLWQVVEGIIATGSILYCWKDLMSIDMSLLVVALVGYVINALAAILGILVIVRPDIVEKLSWVLYKFGVKLRIIRNGERWAHKIQTSIDNYKQTAGLIKANFRRVAIAALLVAGQIISYFLITCFVFLACSTEPVSAKTLLDVFFTQSVLSISVTFIPMPGANGISEGAFSLLFGRLFPSGMLLVGMLIWRVISYHFNLLGGLLVVFSGSISKVFRRR